MILVPLHGEGFTWTGQRPAPEPQGEPGRRTPSTPLEPGMKPALSPDFFAHCPANVPWRQRAPTKANITMLLQHETDGLDISRCLFLPRAAHSKLSLDRTPKDEQAPDRQQPTRGPDPYQPVPRFGNGYLPAYHPPRPLSPARHRNPPAHGRPPAKVGGLTHGDLVQAH